MLRLACLCALMLPACESSDDDTGLAPDGPVASIKPFNASQAFAVINLALADGSEVANGIEVRAGTDYVDVPIDDQMVITNVSDDFTVQAEPLNLVEGGEYSWFFTGAGGGAGWRFEVVEDVMPEPIRGVAHVRFVVARQNIAEPAEIYVDGAVLVSNIGYNQDFISEFAAVSTGTRPMSIDVAGGDYWDTDLGQFTAEDGGVYTVVIQSQPGSGDTLLAKASKH